MKSKIIMLFIAVITVISGGCLKKDKTKYTIKGRLMYDNISNVPAGNIALTIHHQNRRGKGSPTEWNFKSNTDGTFSITFDPANGSTVSLGRTGNSGGLMDNMPSNQDIDLREVYLSLYASVIVQVSFSNNSPDSVYFGDYQNNTYKHIGPFSNMQIIDTVKRQVTLNDFYYSEIPSHLWYITSESNTKHKASFNISRKNIKDTYYRAILYYP